MRVLLTGATGFVGSHLLKALSEHEVFGLHRGERPAKSPGVTWIAQDLRDSLSEELPEQVDAVIHLAQSRHYREFPERADDIFGINVQSTFRLLDYARKAGASRFVFASTGGLYAPSDEDSLAEDDPVDPLNFYLGSKYAAEVLVTKYQEHFTTILCRLFFVYGAGQPDTMLISSLVSRVARGEPIDLFGPDGLIVNPIYVSDVVRALSGALSLEGSQLLNVAGSEVLTLREVGEAIGGALGRAPLFDEKPPREPTRLVGKIDRLTELLGSPQVTFQEGIRRVVAARSGEEG